MRAEFELKQHLTIIITDMMGNIGLTFAYLKAPGTLDEKNIPEFDMQGAIEHKRLGFINISKLGSADELFTYENACSKKIAYVNDYEKINVYVYRRLKEYINFINRILSSLIDRNSVKVKFKIIEEAKEEICLLERELCNSKIAKIKKELIEKNYQMKKEKT